MGSNPQSDPRIFLGTPGFSRSLTHSLTHGAFYRPTLFAEGKIPKKPEATGSAGRCEPGVGRFTDPHPLTCYSFSPLPVLLSGDFFNLAFVEPNLAFAGLERVVSPPWGENRLTGPHRPEKPGAFPQEKTGAAHPRVSLRPSHRLGLAHRAKQAGPGSVLLGAKKPLPGFVGQRPVDCLIHLFSKNVPQCPHKRKAMRSVSWSVTRRKTGFPRMQAPT